MLYVVSSIAPNGISNFSESVTIPLPDSETVVCGRHRRSFVWMHQSFPIPEMSKGPQLGSVPAQILNSTRDGHHQENIWSKTWNYLSFVHSFLVPSESSCPNLGHASGMPTERTRFTLPINCKMYFHFSQNHLKNESFARFIGC